MSLHTIKGNRMFIEAAENKNGAWYWRLVGRNGECLAPSESYSSKSNCIRELKVVAEALGLKYDRKSMTACRDK